MKRVRCPRCASIIEAAGTHVVCGTCGLSGPVGGPPTSGRPAGQPTRTGKRASSAVSSAGHSGASAGHGGYGAPAKDPYTFTVNLRAFVPAAWPAGAKVFAVTLLLVGAFFLGGFAGVAFERAKHEVTSDLERGQSLIGGEQDASGQSGGIDPVPAPSPAPAPSPGPSPSPGSSPSPSPPPSPPPSSAPEEPDEITFDGKGSEIKPNFETQYPLLEVTYTYYGDGPFIVRFKSASGGEQLARVASSDSGDGTGMTATRYTTATPGTMFIDVDVVGDGTWAVKIRQPQPTTGATPPAQDSGNGDDAVMVLELDGDVEFTLEGKGIGSVKARVYSLDGTTLTSCSLAGTSDSESSYKGSKTCTFDAPTLVFVDIASKKDNDGESWLFKATQV